MPYFAPDAPIPITSCAPRLAEMNASPQIHAGSDRPAWKKSLLVFMKRFSAKPMPSTKTKYNSMISQSTNVRFTRVRRHLPQARIRSSPTNVRHPIQARRWLEWEEQNPHLQHRVILTLSIAKG